MLIEGQLAGGLAWGWRNAEGLFDSMDSRSLRASWII
jgi:hypothetical protein